MVTYNLAHLTQSADQQVAGPIQDDEALLIYATIKVTLCRRILEIGGLSGYSARNFIEAVGPNGIVYTVDQQKVPVQGINHRIITKDAGAVTAADVDCKPLDLIFFDCHNLGAQMTLFFRLQAISMITPNTMLMLHDTNLHPEKFSPVSQRVDGGWQHQQAERQMVDDFRRLGYDAVSFHTEMDRHNSELPYRHGLTILRKHRALGVNSVARIVRHHGAILLGKYGFRHIKC